MIVEFTRPVEFVDSVISRRTFLSQPWVHLDTYWRSGDDSFLSFLVLQGSCLVGPNTWLLVQTLGRCSGDDIEGADRLRQMASAEITRISQRFLIKGISVLPGLVSKGVTNHG